MTGTTPVIATGSGAPTLTPSAPAVGTTRSIRPHLELLGAALFFFAFACYTTWPSVTDLSHVFYGAAGDPYGTMSFFRDLVAFHHDPFLPGTFSQLAAPEGQPIPWTRDLASLPGVLTQYLLSGVFGQLAAYGLYILMGYTLTGTVTFAFVRRLTGNSWAALLAGWAFAFYPFAVLNGQGHVDYIFGWVLVIGVWRMLELLWRPTRRNGVLAGLAVAFGMWWNAYFILFGGVAYVLVAAASLIVGWRERRLRALLPGELIAGAIVAVFLCFLVVLSTGPGGNGAGVRANNLLQFNTYSARPAEYVVPDALSPIFGSDTVAYLDSHIHGSNPAEATLYVGDTVILLALVAIGGALLGRATRRERSAVVVLGVLALGAAITSAPPEGRVLGVLVPFPTHFIMQVVTTWRVYSRLVIVVMLALAALMAIGLTVLTRGRGRIVRVLIMLAASVLVPLDLYSRLGGRTNRYAVPAAYTVLAQQPPGLVAEYPLVPAGFNTYNDLFFQNTYRNKPLINGYLQGSVEEQRALSLSNLADPTTGPRLAALGVRYVILELAPPSYGLPSPGTPGAGFRLIGGDSYANLYVVTARPAGAALATPDVGFAPAEADAQGAYNWLEQSQGTIELAGPCAPCRGVFHVVVSSFYQPRTVTLSAGGRTVVTRNVAGDTSLSIPLTFMRYTQVDVSTSPGPQSIQGTVGGNDTRSVSVQVRNPTFVGAPTGAATAHG